RLGQTRSRRRRRTTLVVGESQRAVRRNTDVAAACGAREQWQSVFTRVLRARESAPRRGGLLFARSVDSYSTARTIATSFEHVVRIDDSTYVASGKRFKFRPAAAGMSYAEAAQRLEADRDTILRETEGSPLNRDFRPNSEYYFTYPHARSLQTWGGAGQRYRAREAGWAQSFIDGG